ncbi:PRKCA-binding protein [Nymphon striatum]|nr:PRKCA-binding protein [Nymphon striatum]
MEHAKRVLKAFYDLSRVHKEFGDVFASIGVREPQPRASEAFTMFGESHRNVEKAGLQYLKTIKPMLSDLGTYTTKAIPDTRLTIKKYADAKFEYLSYCLKVKEMDDEEYSYAALQEPLYRVETGNYEYRLILRCRQEQRAKFAKLRSDVLVKIELLDQKHGIHNISRDHMKVADIFPIEVDLSQSCCHLEDDYQDGDDDEDDDDELIHSAQEATETNNRVLNNQNEMNLLGDDFDKLLTG